MQRGRTGSDFDRRFDDLAAVAYRVAYRLTGSRRDAEDIAQEAMIRAYVRWRRVAGHADAWVARVAANLAIDGLRRRGRRPTVPDDGHGAATAARPGVDPIDRLELLRLLDDLPRRQRDVVVLRYLADLTEAATAAELGTSVGSVKQHAHRGLTALRSAWAALDDDPVGDPADGSLPAPGGL